MPDPISSMAPKSREGAASSTSTSPCTKMPRTPGRSDTDRPVRAAACIDEVAVPPAPLEAEVSPRRFQPGQSAPTERTGKRRRCPAEYLNHGKARSSTKELSDLLVAIGAHVPRRRWIGPIVVRGANSTSGSCKHQSGHDGVDTRTTAPGVMQPSAIGAGDDCCDRGRSRSSRALWRRAARQAAPGAHDGSRHWLRWSRSRRGRDRRRPGIWASVRRTAADRRPRARGVAPPRRTQWQKRRGDLSRSRSQAVKRQPAFVCQRH